MRKEGAFIVEDYLSLAGGLNSSDSPFIVQPTQAIDGYNWDYTTRGAITKRQGHVTALLTADSTNPSNGLGLFDSPSARYVIRSNGAVLQNVNGLGSLSMTLSTLTEDTAGAGTGAFTSGKPVNFAMGNTTQSSALWSCDASLTSLLGVYSGTKFTRNGVPQAPVTTANLTVATVTTTSPGYLAAPSYLTYSFTLVKASTGAEGNALPDNVEASSSSVLIQVLSVATSTTPGASHSVQLKAVFDTIDATKYSGVNVYKSQPTGAGDVGVTTPDYGFTAGVLMGTVPIATLGSGTTLYVSDFGLDTAPAAVVFGWAYSGTAFAASPTTAYTDTSALVPRAGNIELDQSPLPTQEYSSVVVWNGRLVTCNGNTIYISDTEKFEAWPLTNIFSVPSGGPITALAVVGLSSGVAGVGINEALCIFKDRELWTLISTGAPFDYTTWQFSFMGSAGCPSQRLVVNTDTGIVWVNYRGIFSWNGAGKPLYLSQPLEDKFNVGGDLNIGNLSQGWGVFYQQKKQVIWCVSSNTYGSNQYYIKLDVRLTAMQTNGMLTEAITHGIFSPDQTEGFLAMQSGVVYSTPVNPTQEYLYLGDDGEGQVYQAYSGEQDGTDTDISFSYVTPYLHMGTPTTRKRFARVVVWAKDVGEPTMSLNYVTDWGLLSDSSPATSPSTLQSATPGVWDVSLWDQAVYGPATEGVIPIVFNLNSQQANNSEGCTLQLQFTDSNGTYTPTIYGYSVYYTEVGPKF